MRHGITSERGLVVPFEVRPQAGRPDSFERVLDALHQRGCSVRRRSSTSARAPCPAHHDRNPSLVVTLKDGKVLMRCFAGCRNADIVSAIGLRLADLFSGLATTKPHPRQIVAVYNYCDLDGVIYAEKVRLEPKAFRWRVPAPEMKGGHCWGLGGISVGLYRLPELVAKARIILTEGEKSADRLAVLDLVTTCPPNGASSWDETWSADLWELGCRELIVLADNDQAGRTHAERVARSWLALASLAGAIGGGRGTVKIIVLPGAVGTDVVDWLDSGQNIETLLALMSNAADWNPEAAAQERIERRRELTRERVRRCRANQRAAARGVTLRTSDVEGVTRNAVTRPNVPLETLQKTRTTEEIQGEKAS